MNRLMRFLGWSYVSPGKKTILWWYHKVLCEIGYWLSKDYGICLPMYYRHLDKCLQQGFNLYGEPWVTREEKRRPSRLLRKVGWTQSKEFTGPTYRFFNRFNLSFCWKWPFARRDQLPF